MRFVKAFVIAGFAVVAGLSAAGAHDVSEGEVTIKHPRAQPTPAGAKTGAAYMEIVNNGKRPLVIKSLSSAAAETAEVHTMSMSGDVMRMRPIELPITIAPGETLMLTKDRHVMLIGLKKPLVEEDMAPFTIAFANGKTMAFYLYVENAGNHSGDDH